MLLIECPNCGPRDETEFHYGGQAHVAYPEDPYALTDKEWAEYLFYRDNTRGLYAERWSHSLGCRKWFNAVRDTVTYEITTVYPMGQPCPVDLRTGERIRTAADSGSDAEAGGGSGGSSNSADTTIESEVGR